MYQINEKANNRHFNNCDYNSTLSPIKYPTACKPLRKWLETVARKCSAKKAFRKILKNRKTFAPRQNICERQSVHVSFLKVNLKIAD